VNHQGYDGPKQLSPVGSSIPLYESHHSIIEMRSNATVSYRTNTIPGLSTGRRPLLATGACLATWLSFAVRRVVLGFNDLA
jgi:hypothetical protein